MQAIRSKANLDKWPTEAAIKKAADALGVKPVKGFAAIRLRAPFSDAESRKSYGPGDLVWVPSAEAKRLVARDHATMLNVSDLILVKLTRD